MSPEQLLREEHKKIGHSRAHDRRSGVDVATIAVVGLGYVGLPLALLAASRGFKVIGFDIDEVKVAQLSRREADFLNDKEASAFRHTPALSVTSRETDLKGADAFIVCVPTPVHEDYTPDLRPLESASAIVGRNLSRGALVIIESTVSPGVCEGASLPAIERASGLSGEEFDFAHCPERINPGDARYDVSSIPRVIGATTGRALERAARLYEMLIDATIVKMGSVKEAEAVKMVENAFRDVNIAFVNELAIAFDRAGIDIVQVIDGASTKPFGYVPFYPGCGVGGHCIPVDPYYLIRYGRQNGFEHRFLMNARRINGKMPHYTVGLLERALKQKNKQLSGSVVALLGLAYKRDVPDTRESPAREIHELLLERGAKVRTYDPYVPGTTVRRLEDALHDADAALIATDHSQFKSLTPISFEVHGVGIVIDGRNCLDKAAFEGSDVAYHGIGRG